MIKSYIQKIDQRICYRYLRRLTHHKLIFFVVVALIGGYLLSRGVSRYIETEHIDGSFLYLRPFSYNYTQYLFNYSDQFVKRGLVGEILRNIVDHPDYFFVKNLALILLGGVSSLLTWLFMRPLFKHGLKCGHYLFFGLAFISPATLMHFAYDLGRLDIISTYLIILGIYILLKKQSNSIAKLNVFFLMVILILIHEGNLVIYIPTLLCLIYLIDKNMKIYHIVALGAILLGIAVLIAKYGVIQNKDVNEHLELLREQYGLRSINLASLKVLYAGGVSDNLELTWKAISNRRYITHSIIFYLCSFPWLYLVFNIINQVAKSYGHKFCLLLLSNFSPLLLSFIAYDHFRWWALSLTNFFIVVSMMMAYNRPFSLFISKMLEKNKKMVFIALILSLVLGPLGVARSYDDFLGYDLVLNIVYFFENIVFTPAAI